MIVADADPALGHLRDSQFARFDQATPSCLANADLLAPDFERGDAEAALLLRLGRGLYAILTVMKLLAGMKLAARAALFARQTHDVNAGDGSESSMAGTSNLLVQHVASGPQRGTLFPVSRSMIGEALCLCGE
jgi:hypothetical protein